MKVENCKVCTECVLDETDPDILFNEQGVCHHCLEAAPRLKKFRLLDNKDYWPDLVKVANEIKQRAGKKKYDSIVGMSGGVDSSYICHLAGKLGLNPLVVHFDNGWNSEIAVSNIKKVVEKNGFDLFTYVIDWPEFKDIQRSFFKASVIDIEMVTDHAIMATMVRIAKDNNLTYVLNGTNFTNEHGMPKSWLWRKQDLTNLKDIQKKFGTKKINSFPTFGTLKYAFGTQLGMGFKNIEFLNMMPYRKDKAMEELESVYGWQYYGGKHYESTFTKFYQAYVLPTKFNVDKRKVHLSAQIRNSEITRDFALQELKEPLYGIEELRYDTEYVIKKLGFSEEEFDKIMNEKPINHLFYKSDEWLMNILRWVKKRINSEG